jgi:hypothetical protein
LEVEIEKGCWPSNLLHHDEATSQRIDLRGRAVDGPPHLL